MYRAASSLRHVRPTAMTLLRGRACGMGAVRLMSTASNWQKDSSWRWTGAATGAAITTAAITTVALADAKPEVDYDEVRKDIEAILEIDEDFDDGSFGPILVRLAWHSSGTYSKKSGDGGSEGARMRFKPESEWGANAGLGTARSLLEPIKKKHPNISYADLWTLAGVVAIEAMGGPSIPWRPGRSDEVDGKKSPPDGRLPDAAQGQDHIRDIFYRMGFNDQEIVALVGAHALGRCHTKNSGFDGPWTRAPTTFSNEFFRVLLNEKWKKKKWNGPEQYVNADGSLMMLPADMALVEDKEFKKWVEIYAQDEERFFKDFSAAFEKLMELGVPFPRSGIFQWMFGWLFRLFGY